MDAQTKKPLLSIVVPCYNEKEVFPFLQDALTTLANRLAHEYAIEMILVDDGSRDSTWEQIRAFADSDSRVRGVALSRNFGHQIALSCGYDLAAGDAIISMDADLQDPPEVIDEMLRHWRKGTDVVYAVRASREGETAFKLWTASLFYKLFKVLGAGYVRENTGDFRLLSRKALDAILTMREQHRFIRGLVGWIGFTTSEVHYHRKARCKGETKYPFCKMFRLAMDAVVSFSFLPLRFAYFLASGLSLVFIGYLSYVFVKTFFFEAVLVPGWTSLVLSVIVFGAINLFCLGIMGEYVGRIYEQSKQRPLYLIRDDRREGGKK